jgi:hypothetical protein
LADVNWITHQGKRILLIDFTRADISKIDGVIAKAKPIIAAEPPFSILCLVDCTGSVFSLDVSKAIKEFSAHNKPFIKMTSVVGVTGLANVVFNGVIMFTGRTNLILKESRAEGLDFLAAQA